MRPNGNAETFRPVPWMAIYLGPVVASLCDVLHHPSGRLACGFGFGSQFTLAVAFFILSFQHWQVGPRPSQRRLPDNLRGSFRTAPVFLVGFPVGLGCCVFVSLLLGSAAPIS